jgi:hypothetical protein
MYRQWLIKFMMRSRQRCLMPNLISINEDACERRVLLAKRNAPHSLVINALRFANASYDSMPLHTT